MTRSSLARFSLALAVATLAACDDGKLAAPTPAITPQFTGGETGLPQYVEICKVGPAGTSATFTVVGSPSGVGTYFFGNSVTLEAMSPDNPADLSKCKTVWVANSVSDATISLTVTETTGTPEEILILGGDTPFVIGSNFITMQVDWNHGAVVRFTNNDVPPPPPGGGEGCTPGYWKQKQHFGSWTAPYTPSTQFSSVFEDAFPGMTLLQVLAQGGGGLKALGRHTVAALLNSASAGVDYDMSTTDVINAFNAVFPGGDYTTLHNRLEDLNEQGCPLGRAE